MNANHARMSGACLCGAVKYACTATPIFQFNCHCRDCQRCTGSAYAPILFFPKEAVEITGLVKYFESTGRTGTRISRGFCPACGSQLFAKLERMPDYFSIRAGTLDDPALYQPRADIYVSQASHWDTMNVELPKFQEMAPQK